MKTNLCNGFLYETEEELQQLLGINEYHDLKFNKGNGDWEPHWEVEDSDVLELPSSLAMDVFVKRKAEGLTQVELARKLDIGLETLLKIENGHENLRSKVRTIIDDYLNEE
ncbi:helix-turn-helix domain-containing protein [Priestia flexa]|uniref:helix-turn-helix domain-containing protein n=1 Tax=Priestia flexa TaxID=86664 RepID=UPI00203A9811|nr:helix-turn-helix domain-containing protein [Priestia flexa]MCM3068568.1 helix-turn-helix domain-containing protein [Priestia flexa]MCP1191332.1 helix-turn-helix domain-containing protein [Priestia flexa]